MTHIRTQAERFGAELVSDDVISVELADDHKVVRTLSGEWTADSVILAMGSAYKKLGVAREDELSGRGVSWCATCDGFFFRGHNIVVVGGGDTAMEEATFLTRFADSVTIVHRRDSLAGVADHGRAGQGEPEDPVRLELRGGRDPRRHQGQRSDAA